MGSARRGTRGTDTCDAFADYKACSSKRWKSTTRRVTRVQLDEQMPIFCPPSDLRSFLLSTFSPASSCDVPASACFSNCLRRILS